MTKDYLSKDPKEVLVIGNGFDVALGLPTQYMDFMDFLRIVDPAEMIVKVQNGNKPEKGQEKFFLADPASINLDEIKRIIELRKDNLWAQYYRQCNADIKGWIDLEHEMLPVFDFVKWVFDQDERMTSRNDEKQIITQSENRYRTAQILPKIMTVYGSTPVGTMPQFAIGVRSDYCDKQYGVFKEKILKSLKEDLDDFIELFRIYLRELVSNARRLENTIIDRLSADRIISFNYVQSEIFFPNLKDAEIIHVHGDTTKKNNIVLGVNEVPNDAENDFLYFTKSFQRIKIKSNPHYRDFWEGPFNVTFFGHSLDVTDIDIIKPLYEKAEHVKVFYYNGKDYETKIQNLIKMTDVQQIENDNYSGRLELLPSGA